MKTAKPLGIKGAPLSLSGGMDEETSEGELLSFRVIEMGASKRKKKAFDWRVLEIFKSSTFASTLETLLDKGGADRPLCTFRCFVSKDDGRDGDGARHEVELSTRVLRCCPRFGEFVTFEGLPEERDTEKTRETTCAFNRMMSASAAQCAATLQGKLPPKKGTDLYQEQEDFRSDWKLYNKIIDLLRAEEVGFRDGSEMSAGKELIAVLTQVLYEVAPAERRRRLENRGVHLPDLFAPLTREQYNDPSRHKHGRLPHLTRAGISGMVEKLLRVRTLPSLQSPSWKSVSSAIGALAAGLEKYGKYLETSSQRINVMHAQMQPARLPRTGESDSLERREGVVRDPGLISRYRSLQEALDVTEAYETAFFINDFALATAASDFAMFTRFNCPLPLNSTTTTKEETWALSGGYGELRMSHFSPFVWNVCCRGAPPTLCVAKIINSLLGTQSL